MYEDQTYEAILARSLDRIATNVDKREGSLVMNAVAPVSAEHANLYILLDSIIRNGYVHTADIREYVVYRCRERGIIPYEATQAVLKGKFNMSIPLGSRFNHDTLNYTAKEFMEEAEGYYYYQMECETAGEVGNRGFGELTPIEYIDKALEGELTELLIPAEDEESIESLKKRYADSFEGTSFGGNKQYYKEKTKAIDGVGGCIVTPVWNGGGTVKLTIIDSAFNVATPTLVASVQSQIDPFPQGEGNGIAPIGHTVTVVTPQELTVDISARVTLTDGVSWSQLKALVTSTLEEYFLELRKSWEKSCESGNLVVRISQIETRILNLEGVLDVADTTLNGVADNLTVKQEKLPMLGEVVNSG
jgi:uncharacterized phage protein gp47/JayE